MRQLGVPDACNTAEGRQCGVLLCLVQYRAYTLFIYQFILAFLDAFRDGVAIGDAALQMGFQALFGFLFEFLEGFPSLKHHAINPRVADVGCVVFAAPIHRYFYLFHILIISLTFLVFTSVIVLILALQR